MSWIAPVDGPIPAPIFGEPDEDGFVQIAGFEPGYRLNVPPELMTDELSAWRVTPAKPLRVFAGDDPANPIATAFLLFPHEDEARSALPEWRRPA